MLFLLPPADVKSLKWGRKFHSEDQPMEPTVVSQMIPRMVVYM